MFGGSWILGGGLDRTSQRPRCIRISRITNGSSMKLMMRMVPLHLGQIKGSTSYIFWISRAQPFLNAFTSPSGSVIQGIIETVN